MKSSWFWKESDGHKRPTALLEWGLVLLSVLLLWLGWPTRGWSGLLFLAFTPLLALMEYLHAGGYRKPGRRAGWRIYVALLLWNVLCTGWVGNATIPGAAFMVLLNALLMLLPWLLYSWMKKRVPRIALFTGLLAYLTLEYCHFHWEMAWPWLNLGFGLASQPGWIQWYDITGVLGGSLWILLANGAFYLVFWKHGAILQGNVRWLSLTYTLLFVIGIPLLISVIRGNRFEPEGTPVEVILVQPNINPYGHQIIGQPRLSGAQKVDRFLALSDSLITPDTRWILWPESTLPGYVWEDDPDHHLLRLIQTWLDRRPQINLVIGGSSLTRLTAGQESRPYTRERQDGSRYEAHNSALWLQASQDPIFYHKSVLVPGVEVLPFASVLQPIIGPIMEAFGGTSGGFAPQAERTVFTNTQGQTVSPSVCYESIFGDFTTQHVQNGAQAIAVITNDAWWGNTQGYRQHFTYATALAISLRRPVLRAANTGISAFVLPDGTVSQPTEFYTQTAIRETVLFTDRSTPYIQSGDAIGRLAYGLLLFLYGSALVQGITQRRKKANAQS